MQNSTEQTHITEQHFLQSYAENGPSFVRCAQRYVGVHDAEDVVQTALLQTFDKLPIETKDPDPVRHVTRYIYRCIVNCGIDIVRQETRRRTAPHNALESSVTQQASREDTAEAVASRLDSQAYAAAVRAILSPIFAEAIIAVDMDDTPRKEYAEQSDTREATLRTRLHRGRAKLRQATTDRSEPESLIRYAKQLGAEVKTPQ